MCSSNSLSRQKCHDSREANRGLTIIFYLVFIVYSTVNDGSADGDGEANDDPIDLVDDLEDSLDVVEEEEKVQEIGVVSSSEQMHENEEDLDASLASFRL